MIKWEYNEVIIPYRIPTKELKRLGLEGWELISTVIINSGYVYYFKRPIITN